MNANLENRTGSTSVQFITNDLIIISSTVVGLTTIACLVAFIYWFSWIRGKIRYAKNSKHCLKHILRTLIKIILFLADIVSDIAMTYIYCIENYTKAFILSLIFTIFPALVHIIPIILIVLKEKEVAEDKSNEKNENDNYQKKKHDEKKEDMTENKCDEKNGNYDDQKKAIDEKKYDMTEKKCDEKNGNDDDQKKENDLKKDDKDNTRRKNEKYNINKLIFFSCLFLSPFIQLFLLTGILAVGAMHKRSEELVRMASLLGLIETTFESAPQIIVQIFINIENVDGGETKSKYFRYITLVGSVLGLAKSMYNFKHDVEKGDRSKLALPTKILSFLSRIAEIGPRVIILALFVSEFRFYSVIFFAVHMVITFGIAFVAGYNNGVLDAFEREREIMLLLLGSFANTFFFCKYKLYENVKEEMQSRITIMFYMLYYIENAVLITLWCVVTRDKDDVWYFYASIAVAIGGLPLHIILFKGYLYLKFHQRRYRTKNGYTAESDGIEIKSYGFNAS